MSLCHSFGGTVWRHAGQASLGLTVVLGGKWPGRVMRQRSSSGSALGYSCTGVTQDRRSWDSKCPSSSRVRCGMCSCCSRDVLGEQHGIHSVPRNAVPPAHRPSLLGTGWGGWKWWQSFLSSPRCWGSCRLWPVLRRVLARGPVESFSDVIERASLPAREACIELWLVVFTSAPETKVRASSWMCPGRRVAGLEPTGKAGQRKKWSPGASSPDARWGLLWLPSARTRKSAKQPFQWKYWSIKTIFVWMLVTSHASYWYCYHTDLIT